MIHFIFTVDYEIYGNGLGSLKDLVYEPTRKLLEIFQHHRARLVFFIEVAELEIIESAGSDTYIYNVKDQIRLLHQAGFEIGLHVHPQWYEARLDNAKWKLNYKEYNLCALPEERISQLLKRGFNYLRSLVQDNNFYPVSFRAGNWLINPAIKVSSVLSALGIKIDSSVFKGGYQQSTGIDYRQAPSDLFFWKFTQDANRPDPSGLLFELPIYTKMIPIWKFMRGKRLELQKKAPAESGIKEKIVRRAGDFLRWKVPLKFDFCRLSYKELIALTEELIRLDKRSPDDYKPVVLIGHTKDSPDVALIESFLAFLEKNSIRAVTFKEAYQKLVAD